MTSYNVLIYINPTAALKASALPCTPYISLPLGAVPPHQVNTSRLYLGSSVDISPLFGPKFTSPSRPVWSHYQGEYALAVILQQLIPAIHAAKCPTMCRKEYFILTEEETLILTTPTSAYPVFTINVEIHGDVWTYTWCIQCIYNLQLSSSHNYF